MNFIVKCYWVFSKIILRIIRCYLQIHLLFLQPEQHLMGNWGHRDEQNLDIELQPGLKFNCNIKAAIRQGKDHWVKFCVVHYLWSKFKLYHFTYNLCFSTRSLMYTLTRSLLDSILIVPVFFCVLQLSLVLCIEGETAGLLVHFALEHATLTDIGRHKGCEFYLWNTIMYKNKCLPPVYQWFHLLLF